MAEEKTDQQQSQTFEVEAPKEPSLVEQVAEATAAAPIAEPPAEPTVKDLVDAIPSRRFPGAPASRYSPGSRQERANAIDGRKWQEFFGNLSDEEIEELRELIHRRGRCW